jgi:hypothetical protein
MRVAPLFLLASVSLSSGCSVMIAGSGKDLGSLTTKAQVHTQFGEPSATGIEGGKAFEDFRTRQKVATWDQSQKEVYAMLMVMTLGTAELVFTPYEVYLLGVRTMIGQTVRVAYDANGKIADLYLDGKPIPPTLPWITANSGPTEAIALPQPSSAPPAAVAHGSP